MNINIYIACHKQVQVLNDNIFHPVQVGTALRTEQFGQYLHDNIGDNISAKNPMYCELTAQYWAWKNENADYYGLMHYRRYFSFDETKTQPYIQYKNMNTALEENCYDINKIERIIESADIIMPIGEKMAETVYNQYKNNHNINDLDIVLQIIQEKYPEYQSAANQYMNSKVHYFCNMFIMKKELFHQYSAWLFDILAEHEHRACFDDYSQEEYRVSGYLAERLLGVFYTYLIMHGDVKTKELARIHFEPITVQKTLYKPDTDKPIIPVVFSSSAEFIPYFSVTLQSLIEHSVEHNFYHIILLHAGGINENDKNKLALQIANHKNFMLDYYDVSSLQNMNQFFVNNHLSVETYFRLFIPDILPFYDKVLYLDCDMVVQNDVSELYMLDLEGYYLAAAKDLDYIGQYKMYKERKEYTTNVLELQNGLEYFQAGVLVLNLAEFRKNYSVEQMIQIALLKKWTFLDQDVLNHICQGKVQFLPQQWNVVMNWKNDTTERMAILKHAPLQLYQEYLNARKNPYVIHYAGYQKPWNSKTCDYDHVFWQYARKTVFYENIMLGNSIIDTIAGKKGFIDKLLGNKALLNKLFPLGSRRRMLAKKMKRLLKG